MTPEQLRQIREIYEQALPLAASTQEAYLRGACVDQDDIRTAVDALLAARRNVPTWLDRPALSMAPLLARLEGRRLSGYTLTRELGHGGMASVYLAERSDDTFHRQAAIKIVMPSSPAVLAHFQQEREILASLHHPNIAQLLDAGVTEEGWPYFVMEFVDGLPIDRWCDQRKLNVTQRIELFRGVTAAVRYAHGHRVVHRDLKPSNIFVTRDGVVKLLDFGIAKILATPEGLAADTLTLARMMTPEYASPEQVTGTAVTALSDVYSLGVVLYELLTGHRPYQLLSKVMHEVARVIAEVEPTRPSEVVTTAESARASAVREGDPLRLRQRLAGDLDAILLMALRKEPERRYGSAESFAEDLERHLDQRSVTAREPGRWERLVRFRRRHPGGTAAATLVAILVLGGWLAVALQVRHDFETARRDARFTPFLDAVRIFSVGIGAALLYATLYFAGVKNRSQALAVAAGGVIWGLGMMGRYWVGFRLGLWHSNLPGNSDPLGVYSPWIAVSWVTIGAAVMLGLAVVGRRFGTKGQVAAVVMLGLFQVLREGIWFSTFIGALTFAGGPIAFLGRAGLFIGVSLLALLAMSLVPLRKR